MIVYEIAFTDLTGGMLAACCKATGAKKGLVTKIIYDAGLNPDRGDPLGAIRDLVAGLGAPDQLDAILDDLLHTYEDGARVGGMYSAVCMILREGELSGEETAHTLNESMLEIGESDGVRPADDLVEGAGGPDRGWSFYERAASDEFLPPGAVTLKVACPSRKAALDMAVKASALAGKVRDLAESEEQVTLTLVFITQAEASLDDFCNGCGLRPRVQ